MAIIDSAIGFIEPTGRVVFQLQVLMMAQSTKAPAAIIDFVVDTKEVDTIASVQAATNKHQDFSTDQDAYRSPQPSGVAAPTLDWLDLSGIFPGSPCTCPGCGIG